MLNKGKAVGAVVLQLLLFNTICCGQPMPSSLRTDPSTLPYGLSGQEPFTNLTIDQLITKALGGIDVASNKLISTDGKVLAELDMMLTIDQFNNLYEPPKSDMTRRTKRKAVRNTVYRWPKGQVHYLFEEGDFEIKEQYFMKRAITEWERYTCLKFTKAEGTERNVVHFKNGDGCSSQLGMVGGYQPLYLDKNGCRWKGLYLHEMGHAIGLVHEHQLPNRDNYIKILWNNVSPVMRIWFNKYTRSEVNQLKVPYELVSVMHYGMKAFSKDGKSITIQAKDSTEEDPIGTVWRKELSFSDVKIVNLMYNCSARCNKNISCDGDGYVDENCQCICPDGSTDCQRGKTTTRSDSCFNKLRSWNCYIFARQGECERNPDFMNENCRRACGACGTAANIAKNSEDNLMTSMWLWLGRYINAFPKTWNPRFKSCEDFYPTIKCKDWAENGDCITNKKWMAQNCRLTCHACSDASAPGTDCENKYANSDKCDEWAQQGECQINKYWMLKNCPKSCHGCNINITDTDSGKSADVICKDKHKEDTCKTWADAGECSRNPTWMITNCRKSCQKCDDGTCKNLYDDKECEKWATYDECEIKANYMRKHCAAACGLCVSRDGTTTRKSYREAGTTDTTTTEMTNSQDCVNIHGESECDSWAKNGHCQLNPVWMKKNCQKSCGACKGVETTSSAEMCIDSKSSCVGWSRHRACEMNPGYMLRYCKLSCKNCNGCKDESILCPAWAKGDQCQKNQAYMLRHCQKSCRVCEG